MNIAFFGLPIAALMLIERGHSVVWAGICRKGAPGTRRLRRALGEGNVEIVPKPDRAHQALLRRRSPDLIVSWYWTKKLPPWVLTLAPHGAIGVHPSLLPRHRGPDPFFWAIDSGDTETGVTAHELLEEYDTGRILGQRRVPIHESDNAWTLAKRLDRPSLELLRDVVEAIAEGRCPPPVVQDESLATLAPEPDEDLLALDFSLPTDAVLRRIRAAAPYPGATAEIGDELTVITRAERFQRYARALVAGEAGVSEAGEPYVRTVDGALSLLGGRLVDDDGERSLDASGFARLIGAARLEL